MASLSQEQATNVLKITVISFVPGVTSFVVPKFAVVILLAKLLNPSRTHIYIMWIICAIYSLMIVGMLTINFAQCTPAAAGWGGAEGVCWDRQITVNYALTVGIVSVLFDFYLAIYPSVVLWQLHLNWKKKLALCSSLGFGYWFVATPCTLRWYLPLTPFPAPASSPSTNAPPSRSSSRSRTSPSPSATSCSGPTSRPTLC